MGNQIFPPAPYVRRHAVEHSAAGQLLDERFFSAEFLPFVCAARCGRCSPIEGTTDKVVQGRPGLVETWCRAAHAWDWDSPGANTDALGFWCAALGEPSHVSAMGGLWRTQWALYCTGSGEILGRRTDTVQAVASPVLPDGRLIAVTGSLDRTSAVWDLHRMTVMRESLHLAGAVTRARCSQGLPRRGRCGHLALGPITQQPRVGFSTSI